MLSVELLVIIFFKKIIMVKSVNTNKVEMDKKAAFAVVFENSEFGKVRTLTDENGEPLFCAKDLCNVLGYKRANDAVDQLLCPSK